MKATEKGVLAPLKSQKKAVTENIDKLKYREISIREIVFIIKSTVWIF